MSEGQALYRDILLPRLVFIAYWLAWLAFLPLSLWRSLRRKHSAAGTVMCIEAGVRGWQSIEFKELHAAAREYLGDAAVRKVEIAADRSYLQQVRQAMDAHHPTHYVYDPRSGSQRHAVGLWQAIRIGYELHIRDIVPIVLLTDMSLRYHRAQSVIITARRGVVVSFMSGRLAKAMFPHRRLVAPSLMPLSIATLDSVLRLPRAQSTERRRKALFVGSLWASRLMVLSEIAALLRRRGFELEIRGRKVGDQRLTDEEYWLALTTADVLVTTAEQGVTPTSDRPWIMQLTYRYLEALAAGTFLVAQDVPGVRRYFRPGEHYAAYDSPASAARQIEHYLTDDSERARVAEQGRARAAALVRARTFWMNIDVALGSDALT